MSVPTSEEKPRGSEAVAKPSGGRPRGRAGVGRLLQTWLFLTLVFAFLAGGGFVAALLRFQSELPSTSHLEKIEPPSNTRIADRHGLVLGDLFAEDRLIVPLVRDPGRSSCRPCSRPRTVGFYEHWGVQLGGAGARRCS